MAAALALGRALATFGAVRAERPNSHHLGRWLWQRAGRVDANRAKWLRVGQCECTACAVLA
eukprot:2859278-Alexandrium_andersonii.AAC.1